MQPWNFLTEYGDSAVTLPLAGATLVVLALGEARRMLHGWLLAVAACGLTVALLKVGFSDCADGGLLGRPFSPSGHTAMSTLVYGGLAWLVSGGRGRAVRALSTGAALALALAIGVSRVVVHAHTPGEVVAGLGLGLLGLLLLQRVARGEALRANVPGLLGVGVLVALLMHGTRWPIEPVLEHLGLLLHRTLPICG